MSSHTTHQSIKAIRAALVQTIARENISHTDAQLAVLCTALRSIDEMARSGEWGEVPSELEVQTIKRTFAVEFPQDMGDLWMNRDNLMMCLTTPACCRNTPLAVADVTGDGCSADAATYFPNARPDGSANGSAIYYTAGFINQIAADAIRGLLAHIGPDWREKVRPSVADDVEDFMERGGYSYWPAQEGGGDGE